MTGLPNITVVLVEPINPGNVGFVARILANFGVQSLRIVGDDPRDESSARIFSVRAVDILESASIHSDLGSALSGMHASWAATARVGRNHSVTRAVVPLEDLPDPLSLDGQVALVFGREDAGLTNDEVSLCDLVFTIPVSKGYPSMNLSHAVAVSLYELFRKFALEEPPDPTEAKPATREEREIVYRFFDEVVDEIDIKDYRRPIAKQVFRNLLGRAYMTGREVSTLTGVVRKILNQISQKKKDSESHQ